MKYLGNLVVWGIAIGVVTGLVFSPIVWNPESALGQSIPTIQPFKYFTSKAIRPVSTQIKVLIGATATTTDSYLETPSLTVTELQGSDCVGTDADGKLIEGTCTGGSGGGLATSSPWTIGNLVRVLNDGSVTSIATSSLGLLTTHVTEGSNLYYTIARVQTALTAAYDAVFGDLSFNDEIKPDGDTCSDGEILKKTGANDWDCSTDLTSGGGGGAISTSTALANTQVVYATGASTVGSEAAFTYNSGTDRLTIVNASSTNLSVSGIFDLLGTKITNVSTWFNSLFDTQLATKDTDDVTQGATNLYNQTHTGEVTGSVGLTVADNVIDEANLKITGSPTDRYILQASSTASGGFVWVATSTLGISGGGGTPGGADTQIQFNNAGSFGGNASLTFNPSNDDFVYEGVAGSDTSNFFLSPSGGQNYWAISDGSTNSEISIYPHGIETYGESMSLYASTSQLYSDNTGMFFRTLPNKYNFRANESDFNDGILDFSGISSSDKNFRFQNVNGHVAMIEASTTLKSVGNEDLILQTGNSTTGNITITDGANGNIVAAPNASGEFRVIGSGDQSEMYAMKGTSYGGIYVDAEFAELYLRASTTASDAFIDVGEDYSQFNMITNEGANDSEFDVFASNNSTYLQLRDNNGGEVFFDPAFGSNVFRSASAGGFGVELEFDHNSASPLANDTIAYFDFKGNDSGGANQSYAGIESLVLDPTATLEDGSLDFYVATAGTVARELRLFGDSLFPSTDTGLDLGSLANRFKDIFLSGELNYDGTPNADHSATGPTVSNFNAGATVTVVDLVVMGSGGTWLLADADAEATSTSLLGFSLESKTSGQAMKVAQAGSFMRDDTWNWTPGQILYVSTTAGGITSTAPSGTDDVVRVVGYAVTADVIKFEPSGLWVVVN